MNNKKCPKCHSENPLPASFCRFCGIQFSEESKTGLITRPVIKDCAIMTSYYTIGSTIEIMWNVENATEIYINDEPVSHLDKYDYQIEKATSIDLIAENEYGKDLRKIKIAPQPLPHIKKFDVTRHRIKIGETVRISFNYSNTERAFLQSNISKEINLSCKKKVDVTPKLGEKYTLVCYSKDPKVFVSRDLELQIQDSVSIEEFSANLTNVMESTPLLLHWKIHNATSIILSPGNIDVSNKNSITMHPIRNTVYSLHAKNEISSANKSISISVRPLPKLEYKIPDMGKLLTLSSINLNMAMLTSNINEINIDKWMASPLRAKKTNIISRCFSKFKNKLKGTSISRLSISLPGYNIIKKCMSIALIIISLMILTCNIIQLCICNVLWINILTIIGIFINLIYVWLIYAITQKSSIKQIDNIDLLILYVILITSSLPSLIMFLCGADYDLYNILGEYILLETDKLIFPISTLSFLTVTFWLSIKTILNLQHKHYVYTNIKNNILNGK